MDVGGSRNWAFLFEEAQCGGPLRRALLLRTLEDRLRRALYRASLSIGSPLGNLERIRLPGLWREKYSIPGFLLGPKGH